MMSMAGGLNMMVFGAGEEDFGLKFMTKYGHQMNFKNKTVVAAF